MKTSSNAFRFAVSWMLLLASATSLAGLSFPQTNELPRKGTVQRIKVHGKALEGNLEGDSPERDVSIYLPPSYATDRKRRYPVVYLLHGFTDSDDQWFGMKRHFIDVPAVAEKALAGGTTHEMILVMPNAYRGRCEVSYVDGRRAVGGERASGDD